MAQGSGTRPWKRGTEAARALLNTVLPNGDVIVTDEGNVYAGDGSTAINTLKRLLRIGEIVGFSDENIQPNTSDVYLDATVDLNGRLSEGTLADGTKHFSKLRASLITLGSTVLSASTPPNLDTDVGNGTGFDFAVVDSSGRVGEVALDETGKVPAWILNAWASRLGLFGPVDILIVAGQSNATERASLPATVAVSDVKVLQYNPANNTIAPVPAAAVDWLGNAFAREYVRRNPSRRVLIVPVALGSSGFTTTSVTPPAAGYNYVAGAGTWDRTLTSDPVNLYSQMITKSLAARTLIRSTTDPTAQFLGVLWSQGESDRGSLTEAQFGAKLDDLIAQARIDLGVSDLPFIIGSLTPEVIAANSAGTAAINAALLDTPRRVQRTSYVWGPQDSVQFGNAGLHYSPQGQAVRGREMANAGLYRAQLNLASGQPVQPRNVRISRSGSAATIEWDHAASRVTAYTLETSTDTGTTWTAQTLAGPLANQFTQTVAAGTPIWARVKTTNEVGTTEFTREAKS